jgi:hypothetical protein
MVLFIYVSTNPIYCSFHIKDPSIHTLTSQYHLQLPPPISVFPFSLVGRATVWKAEELEDSRQGQDIFLFSTMFRPALGPTQLLIQWRQGALSPGVNMEEHEVYHSSPSSVVVKNGGAVPPLTPIFLRGAGLN